MRLFIRNYHSFSLHSIIAIVMVKIFLYIHVHTPSLQQTVATGPTADLDYVSQIKRRVQDGLSAREDREKRRRKVLIEQLKAMHEQEASVCIMLMDIEH